MEKSEYYDGVGRDDDGSVGVNASRLFAGNGDGEGGSDGENINTDANDNPPSPQRDYDDLFVLKS